MFVFMIQPSSENDDGLKHVTEFLNSFRRIQNDRLIRSMCEKKNKNNKKNNKQTQHKRNVLIPSSFNQTTAGIRMPKGNTDNFIICYNFVFEWCECFQGDSSNETKTSLKNIHLNDDAIYVYELKIIYIIKIVNYFTLDNRA